MPSVSRGLRTANGCQTCRKRRVKCDETRPVCRNCLRLERECYWTKKGKSAPRPRPLRACPASEPPVVPELDSMAAYEHQNATVASHSGMPTPESELIQPQIPFQQIDLEVINRPASSGSLSLEDSLFEFDNLSIPDFDVVEWYDLLAEDAINDLQDRKQSNSWTFDFESLSRRDIPRPSVSLDSGSSNSAREEIQAVTSLTTTVQQPWNTDTMIGLGQEELLLFKHYINEVAPILDLFDPLEHFANTVPGLALHNLGLLNALLAVSACHMAIGYPSELDMNSMPEDPLNASGFSSNLPAPMSKVGEHHYYKTLQYLSQHIGNEDYRNSHEILLTAVMISTYGMFDSKSDYSNWDLHLRRAFWIQRDSGISGESSHTLQRAAWCAWLRQDIWAAFCTGRPTLTLHQPNTPLSSLSPDALHQRIIFLAAKCVQFAATPKKGNIAVYIKAGEILMRRLEAWKVILPSSFEPVPTTGAAKTPVTSPSGTDWILPIWIHPPANAAAVQMYHFARIITILSQPSVGGLNTYQTRFRVLRESASVICGIAVAPQTQNSPSAFISFQLVHAAALCVEGQESHFEIHEILHKLRSISRHPHTVVLDNIVDVWNRVMSGNNLHS